MKTEEIIAEMRAEVYKGRIVEIGSRVFVALTGHFFKVQVAGNTYIQGNVIEFTGGVIRIGLIIEGSNEDADEVGMIALEDVGWIGVRDL